MGKMKKAPLITTANCWAAIIAEASRQATGRKMGDGGRVLVGTADAEVCRKKYCICCKRGRK